MRKLFLFFTTILIISCEKEVNTDLTDFDRQIPVCEGHLTTNFQSQRFKITWCSNLESETEIYADDFNVDVDTVGGTVAFLNMGQGEYVSEIPFACTPGKFYTINFSRNTETHTAITQVANFISIDSFSLIVDINFNGRADINLNINSASQQHLRFDLQQYKSHLLTDTVWQSINIPVYEFYSVNPGINWLYINSLQNGLSFTDSTEVFRIITYSLSDDVVSYLNDLKSFMEKVPNGGRYENPPYYYTNEAYGLGYGTSIDTAWFTY